MSKDQIKAYNEMGKIIMDKTGCTEGEAILKIENLLCSTLEVLEYNK